MLGVELPRSADQLLDLEVGVRSASFGTLDQAALVAALDENDLICRMTRAGSDTGLIIVDPPLLTALIEVQTLGKVTSSPANERPPTKTDATVVSDILDRWLSDAASAASAQGLASELLTNGYARVDGMLDLRAVELTLDRGQYRSLSVTMALGGDAKVGTLSFYAPASAASRDDEPGGTLGQQLRPHLLDAPVEMTAILARASRSLDEVMSLAVGDVFQVSAEQLQSVRLETCDGTLVTTARLGQLGGYRAVRPAGADRPLQALPGPTPRAVVPAPENLSNVSAEGFSQMSIGSEAGAAAPATDTIAPSEPSSDLLGGPEPTPAWTRDR